MRNIPPELQDSFSDLKKFVKGKEVESELSYPDAVLAYYKHLGEKLGFSIRENFSVLKHTLNLGKIDLLWVEPKITFTLEFSNLENLLGKLLKVIEFSPDVAILILSSVSGCKPREVKTFLEKSRFFDKEKGMFVIIDIAEERIIQL